MGSQTEGWTDRWIVRQTDSQTDGWTDRWIVRQTDRWTVRLMDGQTDE